MASRRLALNLAQGLRGRAGLSLPMKRGLATPVSPTIKTETTTLKNGLTVSFIRHPLDCSEMLGPLC
jgi:processing peptidase subunit beta